MRKTTAFSIAALLFGYASAVLAVEFQIPLFLSAADDSRQGFIRIINHSEESGTVSVLAVDDSGAKKGPIELTITSRQTVHFNSDDLELGNPDKAPGLEVGIGGGIGDWRLVLGTELDIEPLVYVRERKLQPDDMRGFLTSMHDLVPAASMRHEVAIFNPAENPNQVSKLRLINPGEADLEVTINGVDDKGVAPENTVMITVPAGEARTISSQELESGDSDFTGSFGDGTGKWRLFVTADGDILVMSLLESIMTGHLTNLSTRTYEMLAPSEQAAFDRLMAESGR